MKLFKRLFLILFSLILLVLFLYLLYTEEINFINVFLKYKSYPSIKNLIPLVILSIMYTFPFLIVNAIVLNLILIIKREEIKKVCIENNLILNQTFEKITIIQLSNILYSTMGLILVLFCFGILGFVFTIEDTPIKNTEDILGIIAFMSVGFIGVLIVIDSISISKK